MEPKPSSTKRILIIGILAITVALAGIAAVTAIKLYKLGQEGAAPTKKAQKVPKGKAPEVFQADQPVCQTTFTIAASPSPSPSASPDTSPSPSPSASPGTSPSPSPSPSASPDSRSCWSECDYSTQCPGDLECLEVNEVNRCVNPSCRTRSDCQCVTTTSPSPGASLRPGQSPSPGTTITYIPGQQASPSPRVTPQLPQAGSLSPTLIFILGGLALIGLGLLL